MTGVARGIFSLAFVTPGMPMCVPKNVSPFGPAVWPARGNIHLSWDTLHLEFPVAIPLRATVWNCVQLCGIVRNCAEFKGLAIARK